MKNKYLIRVTSLVHISKHDYEDQDYFKLSENDFTDFYNVSENEEESLNDFHETIPISNLDNFKIEIFQDNDMQKSNELEIEIEHLKKQCETLYKNEIDELISELENTCMNKSHRESNLIRLGFYSGLIELKSIKEL